METKDQCQILIQTNTYNCISESNRRMEKHQNQLTKTDNTILKMEINKTNQNFKCEQRIPTLKRKNEEKIGTRDHTVAHDPISRTLRNVKIIRPSS